MNEWPIEESKGLPESTVEELDRFKTIPESQQHRKAMKVDRRHRLNVKQWLAEGKWVRVKSSNVSHIMYDHRLGELNVVFQGKSLYKYKNVPVRVAEGMFECSSMGKYIWKSVRDKFQFEGPIQVSV